MRPEILSEIAGGPALINLGLHETGDDPTMERLLRRKVRTVYAFCLRAG